MPSQIAADIIQHALDNGINDHDYRVLEDLAPRQMFRKLRPEPCSILPRQFGFWFHTGPGFAPEEEITYGHKLLETADATVLGREGVVVYRGGWLDTMSLNYVRFDAPSIRFRREGDRLKYPAPERRLKGRYMLGFNAGHNNYAHFVTDQLPLLYHYARNLAATGVRLLMPDDRSGFVRQYVDLLRIPETLIDYVGNEIVQVEDLICPTAFSFDAIPTSVVRLLTAFCQDHLPPRSGGGRKLFVSRRDTVVRSLLNEKAICEILERHGFEIIVPGWMSVAEQIEAFRAADQVIGIHGAAMANIAWCQTGTHIIEIFPEYTVSPHFWMMASQFGLKYGAIFGTSFDQDSGLSSQHGSWEGPFVLGEGVLEAVLKDLRLSQALTVPV